MKAVVIGNGKAGKAVFRELQDLREISVENRMPAAEKFIKSVGIVREACRQNGLIG